MEDGRSNVNKHLAVDHESAEVLLETLRRLNSCDEVAVYLTAPCGGEVFDKQLSISSAQVGFVEGSDNAFKLLKILSTEYYFRTAEVQVYNLSKKNGIYAASIQTHSSQARFYLFSKLSPGTHYDELKPSLGFNEKMFQEFSALRESVSKLYKKHKELDKCSQLKHKADKFINWFESYKSANRSEEEMKGYKLMALKDLSEKVITP